MILLARALVRLVSFVLLVVLALAGLAAAIFSIGTGATGPSLSGLASLLRLPALRDTVGTWLVQLEGVGPSAVVAGLAGLGAILLGAILLVGALVPRRERLVTLATGAQGALAARRRALSQVAVALVEQVRGVSEVRVRVRPYRRTGGRLAVRASRTRAADASEVKHAVNEQLRGVTDPFKLKARIDVRRQGARVQ